MPNGLARLMLPCGHIELPAVPRAGDDATRQLSLSQGTTLVRAHAVERIEAAVDIKEGHQTVAGDKFAGRTFGEIIDPYQFMPGRQNGSP